MERKSKFGTVLGATIFITLGAASTGLFGWFMAQTFNALGKRNGSEFYFNLLMMTILLVAQGVFPIFEKHFVFKHIGAKISEFKDLAFKKEIHNKRGEGFDISNFSTKIDQIYQDNLYSKWLIFNREMVFIFSSIAIIALNPLMYLVALGVSFIPLSVPNLFTKKVQAAAGDYASGGQRYLNFVGDILKGRMEILKYGAFEQFNEKHRSENELFESKRYKTRLTTFKASIITNVSAVTMILGVILVGGIQIIQGKQKSVP